MSVGRSHGARPWFCSFRGLARVSSVAQCGDLGAIARGIDRVPGIMHLQEIAPMMYL